MAKDIVLIAGALIIDPALRTMVLRADGILIISVISVPGYAAILLFLMKIFLNKNLNNMNQSIKSHWKLAYRTFIKAVKVTFQTLFAMMRASRYSFVSQDKLSELRREISKVENEALDYEIDRRT